MLAKSKKSFEQLYARGSAAGPNNSAAARPIGSARTTPFRPNPDSATARVLNERFGQDWQFEIAEQQRDGDEAIVLGKLTFGKGGAVRTQFGHAAFSHAAVTGASGGLKFKIDAGGANNDRDAFRRAAEAALKNCVDLI